MGRKDLMRKLDYLRKRINEYDSANKAMGEIEESLPTEFYKKGYCGMTTIEIFDGLVIVYYDRRAYNPYVGDVCIFEERERFKFKAKKGFIYDYHG